MRAILLVLVVALGSGAVISAADHPLAPEKRAALARSFAETVTQTTRQLEADPRKIEALSRRGDALFFQGKFREALDDYDRMLNIDPSLEKSHWRRGIAVFYAGDYAKAARQFDAYHSFDQVDRENGIWRYLSHHKAFGKEKARAELLKYEKDDREPFPAVYRLFAGTITPDEILKQIREARVSDTEREKRLFYAELYIGLNEAVEGRPESALPHLRAAVANTWAPTAGYGPAWMWHVGRLHYELLAEKQEERR